MKQILRCDWLPERARWSYLARSGLPAVSRTKHFPEKPYNKSFIDQACSIKMAGYWPRYWPQFLLGTSLFFYMFMDVYSIGVYEHAPKKHGQYQATLTSRSVNNIITVTSSVEILTPITPMAE